MAHRSPELAPLRSQNAIASDPVLARVWRAMGTPRALVVGGYLRDSLLGRSSADLDLVIPGDANALSGPARRLAAKLGGSPHLLGTAPRCVWRVETDELKVELWPLGELGLEQDAARRDFSCNALMWPLPGGPLLDLVSGVEDIRAGRLRAIRRQNLERDPVRVLRAARFLAHLPTFTLDPETESWVRELAPRLAAAPRERVAAELLTMLRAPAASVGVQAAIRLGLWSPAAPRTARIDHPWLERHVAAADLLARPARHPLRAAAAAGGDAARLAFLLRSWRPESQRAAAAYSWPKAVLQNGQRAAHLLDRATDEVGISPASRRRLVYVAGSALPALVALGAAVAGSDPDTLQPWRRLWRLWLRRGSDLVAPRPLLSADVVTEILGIEPGPALGKAMRALLMAQVDGSVRSKNGARRWLERRALNS